MVVEIDEGILEFGKQLIETGDLDPVYIYFAEKYPDINAQKRWLLAYSMFYHVGVANYVSQREGSKYWDSVYHGSLPGAYGFPRGEERRHFRGHSATKSIAFMEGYFPEAIVESWYRETDFNSVTKAVQRLPIYGPWIAFKMADMGERCLRIPIDFTNCELGIYQEPRQGAALVLKGDKHAPITNEELAEVIKIIVDTMNSYELMAPPWYDRPINVQEAETILCKYKSAKGGHYFVGKDIEAVKKAIQWQPK